MAAIDSAICSAAFWASVRATHEISLEAEYVGCFAEGCFCHEDVLVSWALRQVGGSGLGGWWSVGWLCLVGLSSDSGLVWLAVQGGARPGPPPSVNSGNIKGGQKTATASKPNWAS